MEYFISDMHLGHANILKNRTMFSTIEEMNETLIERWNKKVHKDDHVYILGDFCYRSKIPAEQYLEQLKGKKHLIMGNHEIDWLKGSQYDKLSSYFESIDSLVTIKRNKIQITLCHFPMLEWNGSRYASQGTSYLIHGHIHEIKNEIYEYIKANQPTALNCGVDINNFEPVTFEELIENNRIWYDRASTVLDIEMRTK